MAAEKFELSLKKLEDAVNRLESGDLTLTTHSRFSKRGSDTLPSALAA